MINRPRLYSEESSRRWLSWLARNMRDRSQSVFTVEGLQPDWLGRRSLIFIYLIVSRFFWVFALMLAIQLAIPTTYSSKFIGPFMLWVEVRPYQLLSNAMILALVFIAPVTTSNLIHLVWSRNLTRNHQALTWLSTVALFTVTTLSYLHWILPWIYRKHLLDPGNGWEYTLVAAIGGPVLGWQAGRRKLNADIRSMESYNWSAKIALGRLWAVLRWPWLLLKELWRKHAEYGPWRLALVPADVLSFLLLEVFIVLAFAVLYLPVVIYLAVPESYFSDDRPIAFKVTTEMFAFVTTLFLGTLLGIRSALPALNVKPNGGILRALKMAVVFGSAVAALGVCGLAILGISSDDHLSAQIASEDLGGIGYGLAVAVALLVGGIDVMNHYILRLLLYLSARYPLRIVRFLDYAATDLQILQKVGGGYIFVHRYLLEHFAEMNEDRRAA